MNFEQWWETLETREQRRADKELVQEAYQAGVVSSQQREQELMAHVERLWEVLSIAMVGGDYLATPAQSLARLRNGVLEEAAKKCEPTIWADVIRAMKEPEYEQPRSSCCC